MDIQIIREAKTLNLQYVNDEGVEKPWEMKYITLDDKDLKIRDDENSTIVKSTIHLYDIYLIQEEIISKNVEISNNDIENRVGSDGIEMSPSSSLTKQEQQIILKIKTNSHSSIMWKLEMDDQDMYDRWCGWIDISKVRQKQRELIDLEAAGTITSGDIYIQKIYKDSSSSKKRSKCCSFNWFLEGYKFWIAVVFVFYTIGWVILFGVLWVNLNQPVIGINAVETTCLITDTDWYIIVSDDYGVTIDVTYQTEDNRTLSNTATQYCYSYACLFTIESQYPKDQNMTCFYDKSDPDFVFFNISEIILYRILLNFTITGTLLIPWMFLFVCVVFFVYQKIKGKK